MDYQFALSVIGLLLNVYQTHLTRKQLSGTTGKDKVRSSVPPWKLYWPTLSFVVLILGIWVVPMFTGPLELPEAGSEDILVVSDGNQSNAAGTVASGYINVNGDKVWPFRDKYRLVMVCYFWDGLGDELDVDNLEISRPYDIRKGPIYLSLQFSQEFIGLLKEKRARQIHYSLLELPRKLQSNRFRTIRQAKAIGGREIWTGGTMSYIPYY